MKLPKIKLYKHNSCADLCKYNGKYYLAFRTAPSHFPHPKSILHILTSEDCFKWKLEKSYNFKRDIREPRFIIFKDDLLLYFFLGNKTPFSYMPRGIYLLKKSDNWSNPKKVFHDGFVNWRIRSINNPLNGNKSNENSEILIMSMYRFKRAKLNFVSNKGNVFLAYSKNGKDWNILNNSPIPLGLNGVFESSEFEFIFLKKDLFGVLRSELYGSRIIKIKDFLKNFDYSKIEIIKDIRRFDSPLLFTHNGKIYLISRRHLGTTGRKYNLVKYSLTRKRTSLYVYDNKKGFVFLMDFPSHGDTAFPSIAKINENKYIVINYSSVLGKGDYSWIKGQFKETRLYSYILAFDLKKFN